MLELRPIAKAVGKRGFYRHGLDGDDVEQQAMLRVMLRGEQIRAADNPRGYAVMVIKGTILDMIQQSYQMKRSAVQSSSDKEGEWECPVKVDPMFNKGVEDGLASVSAEAARALSMVWIEGYDRKEVADLMGLSASVVNRNVALAYEAIAEQVGLPKPRTRERKDMTVYLWRHEDGREVRTTRTGMGEYGVTSGDVHVMVRDGKMRKGWKLA